MWMFEQWKLSAEKALRESMGSPLLASNRDKSLFTLIKEALTIEREARLSAEAKLSIVRDLIHDDVPHKYQDRLLEVLK